MCDENTCVGGFLTLSMCRKNISEKKNRSLVAESVAEPFLSTADLTWWIASFYVYESMHHRGMMGFSSWSMWALAKTWTMSSSASGCVFIFFPPFFFQFFWSSMPLGNLSIFFNESKVLLLHFPLAISKDNVIHSQIRNPADQTSRH